MKLYNGKFNPKSKSALNSRLKNGKSGYKINAKNMLGLKTKQQQQRKISYKMQQEVNRKGQTRNHLNQPVGNGLFIGEETNKRASNIRETIYPSNAYQQVEQYVDSVLHNSATPLNYMYERSMEKQQTALERNAVASPPVSNPVSPIAPIQPPYSNVQSAPITEQANARTPVPPPPPPPPPPVAPPPPPPPPPVAPPPPPPPAPASAAVLTPTPAPSPIPPQAPGPASPPSFMSLPDKNDQSFLEPGQVVDMPGPNGKPMKYYVQSYTSEIVPDGKGGYKEVTSSPSNKEEPAVSAPATSTSKGSKNAQHRAKINDCTIAIGNHTEEQSQASKRVYSLGGHGKYFSLNQKHSTWIVMILIITYYII